MSENRETENLRSPRFGLNVSYHRDQAKHGTRYIAIDASENDDFPTDFAILTNALPLGPTNGLMD